MSFFGSSLNFLIKAWFYSALCFGSNLVYGAIYFMALWFALSSSDIPVNETSYGIK
jgi:hypothetical protein